MNNNIDAFLALVRAGLWEKEVQLSHLGSVDYTEIYRLASEQTVVGLVAAGLEHVRDIAVPRPIALDFVQLAIPLEERNNAMNDFILSLVKKMKRLGIYALLLKGQGLAQVYERPLWRSCGDVDLFLFGDNYEKAKSFLLPLATSVEKEYQREMHLGMVVKGFVVELHGTLYCGLSPRVDSELDAIKRAVLYDGEVGCWQNGDTHVFTLSVEDNAVYVFTHILQHFFKGGVDLRQICDWCRLLWKNSDNIDLKKVEARINRMGLMSEWKAFGSFAVEYLGMPGEAMLFYSDSEKWKRKAERICAYILETGNMGHNRDMSYFSNQPYLIRKCVSMGRRIGDLMNHARTFPFDSLRFLPTIMLNGVKSAMKGE